MHHVVLSKPGGIVTITWSVQERGCPEVDGSRTLDIRGGGPGGSGGIVGIGAIPVAGLAVLEPDEQPLNMVERTRRRERVITRNLLDISTSRWKIIAYTITIIRLESNYFLRLGNTGLVVA